jgi:aerobic-type carbon monoxide dehydrogenase small subunit (CoxS/CutS family)
VSSVEVDGEPRDLPGSGTASLWDVLEEAGAAPPLGCATGHCGACTVLLDAEPVPACVVPASLAAGARVATVRSAFLPELVEALARAGAVQCGFCSPGLVVALSALVRHTVDAGVRLTADEVREALVGHLCRCTGYQAIVAATVETARRARPPRGVDDLSHGDTPRKHANPNLDTTSDQGWTTEGDRWPSAH